MKKQLITLLATLTLTATAMGAYLVVPGNNSEYLLPPELQGEYAPKYEGLGRAIYCGTATTTYRHLDQELPFYNCVGDTPKVDPNGLEGWLLYICKGGECYNRANNLLFTMEEDYEEFAALIPSTYELTWDDGMYIAVDEEWTGPDGVNYPTFNDLICTADFSICTYQHAQYSILELYSKGLVPVFNSRASMSDGSYLPDDVDCPDGYCYDNKGNKVGLYID